MGHSAPNWSPPRLAIALAIQAALAVVDIAIPGSTLTITGSVLLVPLVLAVIGQEREVAITRRWWRSRSPSAARGGTTRTGTGQTIYRIIFFALFAVLAVVAARARERATALAGTSGSRPSCAAPRRGWTASSARWARRSPCTTSAARPCT